MMHKLIAGAVTRQSGMWRLVAVCALVLATLLPSLALAAKPVLFNAGGQIASISDGTVKPAGDSGRWVVVEREIDGVFAGDLSGPFTMNYKANVELLTQAGNLHGTVKVGSDVLNVNGTIQPLVFVGPYGLPKLSMTGHWNFTSGAQGQGNFTAWVIFMPTPEGHVGDILASDFSLTGQWQP